LAVNEWCAVQGPGRSATVPDAPIPSKKAGTTMNKPFTAAAALGLGAVLALAGCSSSGSSSNDGTTTLKLVAADYGDGPSAPNGSDKFWKHVVDEFQAANPKIKVNVQVINWNDIDKQVSTMVQNGQVPDILNTGDYAGFVKDNLLYPVSDVLSPNTQQDLIPVFADKGKVNGTAYGIPFVSSARALFYNKDLFAKAGITAPPKTWDEIKADATKLKGAGVTEPYGLPLGNEEAQAETFLWTLGNGGGYKDASGKWAIDSQANVDTFNWLKTNLVGPGLTEPNPGTKNRKDVWADFGAGKVGMANGGPMSIPIFEAGGLKNFGVTPIPGRTAPLDTTLGVEDWIMAFNKNGHKDAIRKFMDFYFSSDAQAKISDTYKLLPVTASASAKLSTDPNLKPFLDLLPKATFYPFTDPKWSDVNTQIKQTVGGAVTGDPKTILGAIQKTATG
jgi:multiple sugar transport system substrate-binding protein